MKKMTLICSSLLSLSLIVSCSNTQSESVSPAVANLDLKNAKQPEASIVTSGQPTEEQLKLLSKQGVKHVVNLRPKSEQEFDEGKLVKALGMNYISIPIDGAAGLTAENVEKFDRALGAIGGEKAVIHCASGNRVGALAAMREATIKNQPTSSAIATGKKWGLTSLEPAVKKNLSKR
jgi:uncharacterized protein (TIGR01244 family)